MRSNDFATATRQLWALYDAAHVPTEVYVRVPSLVRAEILAYDAASPDERPRACAAYLARGEALLAAWQVLQHAQADGVRLRVDAAGHIRATPKLLAQPWVERLRAHRGGLQAWLRTDCAPLCVGGDEPLEEHKLAWRTEV